MAAIEVILKTITDPKTVQQLKDILSKGGIDDEKIEKAKKELIELYGYDPEES